MRIKILVFAQARDQLGFDEQEVECEATQSAREIIESLGVTARLESMRAAVDCEYRDWNAPIGEAREIAVIPPVSGG